MQVVWLGLGGVDGSSSCSTWLRCPRPKSDGDEPVPRANLLGVQGEERSVREGLGHERLGGGCFFWRGSSGGGGADSHFIVGTAVAEIGRAHV